MRKKSAIAAAICLLISAANSTFAESSQQESVSFGDGKHSSQMMGAIPTTSYVGPNNIIKTTQITYPTVYVSPAYSERWFSTLRVCNTLSNFSKGPLAVKLQVFDSAGNVVKTIANVSIAPNGCLSYTSDVDGDPLFDGVPNGVYSVTATVIAKDADSLAEILNTSGNLNGAVNSTARDFFKA